MTNNKQNIIKNDSNTNNDNIIESKIESEPDSNKLPRKQTKESSKQKYNEKNDKEVFNNEDVDYNKKEKNNEKHTNFNEEISNLRDERLRLLAEMENLRKRSEKEKVESIKFGSSNLARDILSTNDNLTRALDNVPEEKNRTGAIKNLIDGLRMVQKEFTTILERHGIKRINALNNKFDHNLHQAMIEIETEDKEEGIVVQEIQSGYIMHDRLLRPTMVGVSKKPQQNKKNK